ncbi:TetR/AcrR family transcriptional regulator [Halalkalibacter sp. APA_J-10(15)]|uniref:TetR/AcrR family transcriptional regulator n=1 Tax=unclassified Halalkalibacter TaxID=2893063 RepID=UPI001FF3D609|nr:TetR/AcrR family transcriptional regulator [Halalkalibacter sp. APA_J-10(15)]MCK0471622.1 TetR/AcrR family transcriptional regulator [Halalkalibacter sp. APA_J-10(15)]
MSPRKRASEELTKEMILHTARKQIVNKGYQHVSMRSIASELGCSHGALYYHMKNKAELFYSIVEADFNRLNRLIEGIVYEESDNQDQLLSLFLTFIQFGLNHQSEYEVMFMTRNEEVDSLTHQSAHLCYQTFAKAVHRLAKRRVTLQNVYSAFVALHGYISHQLGYVNEFIEVEEAARSYALFVLRGLLDD